MSEKQVNCPKNRHLCRKTLATLYTKVAAEEKKIVCQADNAFCAAIDDGNVKNSCECIIKYATDKNPNHNCEAIYKILKKMYTEDRKSLIQQAKYFLIELIKLRTHLKQPGETESFGTYQWWLENIWGTNRFQNYLYIISAMVVFIAIVFFSFSTYWQLASITSSALGFIPLIILLFISLGIAAAIIITIITSMAPAVNKETRENRQSENLGIISVFTSVLVVVLLAILFIAWKSISLSPKIAIPIAMILAGIILAFNFYFAILIPQLLIIGVILQRVISQLLASGSSNAVWFVVGLVGAVSIIMMYVQLGKGQDTDSFFDECSEEHKKLKSFFYYLAPYSFLILTLLVITVVGKAMGPTVAAQNGGWGLYLSPILNFLMSR